jgi:hypothetical protein
MMGSHLEPEEMFFLSMDALRALAEASGLAEV